MYSNHPKRSLFVRIDSESLKRTKTLKKVTESLKEENILNEI